MCFSHSKNLCGASPMEFLGRLKHGHETTPRKDFGGATSYGMKSELKKTQDGQAELTVEMAKDDLQKYINKAEGEIGKDFQMDGFRKGKVPKDLLKKHTDPNHVRELALQLAIQESLDKTIANEKLDALNIGNLEIKENSADKLIYKVRLVLFPDFTMADLTRIKIEKKPVSVTQKEIDDTIETVRASRAKLIDKDEAAETGDRVEVDFEVKSDGKIIEGGTSKNHPLIIGGKNFMPGFEEQLVGMKKGEEKSFSLRAPADYFQKSIAGKELDFTVKAIDIKSVQKPELNHEFALNLGKFKNLDELYANIKEGILQEKESKERQRVRLEILDNIVKASDIKAPDIIVEQQLEEMMNGLDNDLHNSGMELGPYLAHIGKTQEELKKGWRNDAEKQVKIALILHKIVKDKKFAVSADEVEQTLNLTIQSLMLRGGIEKPNDLDIESMRKNIADKIINEKALVFLETNCVA